MPPRPVDSLLLQRAEAGGTLRLSLQTEAAGRHEAVFAYRSPVRDEDAAETRWLLEDHPRLRGRSSDPIASRIAKRLRALAGQLRLAVFESAEGARPIRKALADSRLLRRLRVVVEEPPSAPWTPWELMLAPGCSEPLSVRAACFSRCSPSAPPAPPAGEPAVLRVLLVTCRPGGEEDVPFRSVASRIVQAAAASSQATLQVDVLRPPTYPALRAALTAASSSGASYDVVHFDGHGVYRGDVFNPSLKRGYLTFEGPDGSRDEVSGSILGEDLAREGVRWLLLNACRSAYAEPTAGGGDAPGITERAFGSLASEVRAAGVAGVLAVGFNLYVVTAARLVADTYAALAAGRDLGEAVAHARRRLYRADPAQVAGAFDWLVPIAFHGEGMAGPRRRGPIPELGVQVSTTTPTSAGLVDPAAAGGPRSDQRPFFGYDDVLLRLDRACTAGRPVEVVGLAGSGKSAVAGECARWWVATSPAAAVILDTDSCASYAGFEQELAERLQVAGRHAENGRCLVVLEGASSLLDAGSQGWTADDRVRLRQWLERRAAASAPLVLTGRTSCGLPAVERLVLEGLDAESRAELAAHAGFGPEDARAAPGLLDWSQGVPGVVLQLPRIVAGVTLDAAGGVRKLLFSLRSGKTDGPELGLALMERSGLAFLDVSRLRRAALPFVLGLFQSHISDHGWQFFCLLAADKGMDLARDADPAAVLREELGPAVRAGLACRVADGYRLHPLAPIAIEPGFAATMQVLTRGTPDLVRQVMGLAWGCYIQSVRVTLGMPDRLPGQGGSGALRQQRENLWNAVEISVLGAWWDLALPLLHRLRDALLAEARDQEWRGLLAEVFERLRESPPDEQEMSPESAELQIVRLVAREAEREGNEELVQALREFQLRRAYAEDVTVVPVDPGRGKEIDIGRNRRISALLERGHVAARQNAPECLALYREALRLAEESNDVLRGGEAHLAIAQAHLNVTAHRDPAKYEHHARRAIEAGRSMGPFGLDLVARGSASLGNAILEEQRRLERPDRGRLGEARDALSFAATAEAAGPSTRGSAHNGLGNLRQLENDPHAAADEYLAACKEFEAGGDTRSLLAAQTNGAKALALCGRLEDARSLALQAVAGLPREPALAPVLLPALQAVLTASEPGRKS